jgi:hypothetical protein
MNSISRRKAGLTSLQVIMSCFFILMLGAMVFSIIRLQKEQEAERNKRIEIERIRSMELAASVNIDMRAYSILQSNDVNVAKACLYTDLDRNITLLSGIDQSVIDESEKSNLENGSTFLKVHQQEFEKTFPGLQ